jgi:glutamate receptor, ionotropic, plant
MASQGARAIIGSRSSVASAFVADLATRAEVPAVSFSATSPSVSPSSGSAGTFFVRAALAEHFGWRRIVPVYQDDDYGAAFLPYLVDALTASSSGAEVPYRCSLPAAASEDAVAAAMYRLESAQTRAFVLHARPALAARVLDVAVEA